MFGNSFFFLFSKTGFWKYKEKTIFLYFLNQKHVWLVEFFFFKFFKKIETIKICCYQNLNSNTNSLNEINSLN